MIGQNPSPIGGTWAWCMVNADGTRTRHAYGYVTPADLGTPTVSNNHTELLALVLGLEALPAGWAGTVYSDSWVSLQRVFLAAKLANVPPWLVDRLQTLQKSGALKQMTCTLPDGEEPQHGLSFELQPLKGLPFTISRSQRYETGKLFVSPLLAHSESDQDAVISVQPSSGTYTMLRPEIQTLVCALVHFVCRQTGARTVTYHFARSKIRTLNIHFRLLEQPVKHPARLLNDLAVYLSEEWEKNRAKTS
jgi:hypothetical protein